MEKTLKWNSLGLIPDLLPGGKRQHDSQPTLLTRTVYHSWGDGDEWETRGPDLAPGMKLVLCDSQELPGQQGHQSQEGKGNGTAR